MSTILIADDEMMMRKLIEEFLKKDGHHVISTADGMQALETISKTPSIDLAILDVMMPGLNGFEVLTRIRESGAGYSKLPIIMLTAHTDESDEVKGLNAGAQDYIGKPFSPSVLCARVNMLLKWEHKYYTNVTNIRGITVNELRREIYMDGKLLELTPKEYELLVYFKNNKGVALSRSSILNAVWGYDHYGDLRTVDTHVKKLRSKLSVYGKLIETVRGFGYRFEDWVDEARS